MKINDETREAVRKAVGDQLGAGVGTAEMPCGTVSRLRGGQMVTS